MFTKKRPLECVWRPEKPYIHRLEFEINFHLWWTRNFDKSPDLILMAMNAHDYMMDKNFGQEFGFDPYSNECSWNYMMDNNFWQEFGFDLYSYECSWNYQPNALNYDMLWFLIDGTYKHHF